MLRNFLIFFFNITFVFSQSLYDNLNFLEKKWVDSIYSSLTTEEKVAQLFNNWVSPEHHPADLRVHRELHRQLGPHRVDPDACHQKRPLPDHVEELHELGEDAGLASRAQRNQRTPR